MDFASCLGWRQRLGKYLRNFREQWSLKKFLREEEKRERRDCLVHLQASPFPHVSYNHMDLSKHI